MAERPPITVSSLDLERLENLLDKLPDSAFPGKADLQAELLRAEIVEPEEIPPTVVTMNSTVRFSVDGDSAKSFDMTLVYPHTMDGDSAKVSILAPVGSALLGLSEGDAIEWPRPGGGTMSVRIERIIDQPERAGEYHR